jgi:hypothetical protein
VHCTTNSLPRGWREVRYRPSSFARRASTAACSGPKESGSQSATSAARGLEHAPSIRLTTRGHVVGAALPNRISGWEDRAQARPPYRAPTAAAPAKAASFHAPPSWCQVDRA